MKKYGTAGQATAGSTVRRTRFACWLTNAAKTHSEYVILIVFFFAATLVTRTRLVVTFMRTLPVLFYKLLHTSVKACSSLTSK